MDKPNLILRPTVIGGDRTDDDYCVYFEGRGVGRIRRAAGNAEWEWVINPPLPIPSWCKGAEPDLEQAKAALRKAWERFYSSLKPGGHRALASHS